MSMRARDHLIRRDSRLIELALASARASARRDFIYTPVLKRDAFALL
jgi:hypothetical protein